MKRISPLQIAIIFTGSFLGAGFLSGQELLQFFGQFGLWGLVGMVLAIGAFVTFSLLALVVAKKTGFREFDKIIVRGNHPLIRGFFSVVFLLFLFGCMMGMVAGAGALLEQLFGLPALVGNLILAAVVFLVAVTGAQGILTSFGIVVPLLVAAALVVGVLAFLFLPAEGVPNQPFSSGNPLLGSWFFSALSFISYNMMAAITILVPLSRDMEDTRTIRRGMALGAGLLTLIFVFILLPMILYRTLAGQAELPMLALASRIFPALGVVYALLLLCGMFTAALSSLFGITSRMEARLNGRLSRRFVALLCTAAFAGSIFGFKNVVSYIYPLCGYVGFFALIGVALHARALRGSPASPPEAPQDQPSSKT